MSIYQFSANTISGQEVSLKDYQGKVLLIVNTASKCGFTPQFEGLESLYKEFREQGFEILAFPCNQHPLYDYLKSQAKGLLGSKSIKWNFTKFLVDQTGDVVKRYGSADKPSAIKKEIEVLLA